MDQYNLGTGGVPLLSVIIPVFNSEDYIEKCLDSVITSAFSSLEIICVDDGSTDRSLQILQSYSKMDPRIKILGQSFFLCDTPATYSAA